MSNHLNIVRTPLTPMPSSGLPTFEMIAQGITEVEGPAPLGTSATATASHPHEEDRQHHHYTRHAPPVNTASAGRPKRSLSAPTRPIAKLPTSKHLTTASPDPERNVKRTAANVFAKSTFFHGAFTSSHGAMLMRHAPRFTTSVHPTVVQQAPNTRARDRSLLLMPPSMRKKYLEHLGPQGATAFHLTNRPPRLVIPPDSEASPMRRRSLSAGRRASFNSIAALTSPTAPTRVLPPKRSTSQFGERMPLLVHHGGPHPMKDMVVPAARVPQYMTTKDAVADEEELLVEEEEEHDEGEPTSYTDAMIELLPLAVPSAISMALTFGLSTIPLAFIGSHMGVEKLNGASVGYFIISILAQYPICGLTFALDTLVSHEYGRNNTSDVLGLLLQRGILVNLAFAVPVCFVLTNYSHPILSSIYGVELAVIASDFLRFTPLFLIPLVFFTAFSKFCANQMLPQIPMIAMVCGVVVTPVAQRKLIHLGVEGSMLGMAVAAWVQLLVVILLTFAKKETRQTFGAIRIGEALDWEDVSAYLKLALPSALFVAAEASAFDLTVLLAAKLGDAEGAAWSAILNSCLPFVSLAGGLSAAACAKVGSSLGSGYPTDARRYAFTAVGAAFCCAVLNSGIIWTFFDVLLRFFGTEGAALEVANSLLPIVPLMHIGDSVQFAFQGVFSGCGQNHKGALILLSSLWAIGFPASCVLAFWFGLGVRGIVMGLTIGLLVESPCMIWAAYHMDWQQLAEDAQEEALEDDEEEEEEEEEEELGDGDGEGESKVNIGHGVEASGSDGDDDELEEEDESEVEEQPVKRRRRPRRGRSRTPKPILADDGVHVLAPHRMSSNDFQ